jgi:hypothetical protein
MYLTLHSVITPTPVWRKCIREGCHPDAVVRSAVRNNKTSGESECTPRWQTSQNQDSGNTGERSYHR